MSCLSLSIHCSVTMVVFKAGEPGIPVIQALAFQSINIITTDVTTLRKTASQIGFHRQRGFQIAQSPQIAIQSILSLFFLEQLSLVHGTSVGTAITQCLPQIKIVTELTFSMCLAFVNLIPCM